MTKPHMYTTYMNESSTGTQLLPSSWSIHWRSMLCRLLLRFIGEACCAGSSDEHSNCWEAFSSKSSIVPETVASAQLVAPTSSPSKSCDACTSSSSVSL